MFSPAIMDNSHTIFRIAAILFFLVCALMYVPIIKAMMLKNGTQVCSGRNFWANANANGDVIQLTFMTGMKPALTVALIWWKVLAPAIMAIDVRYTVFWIGDTYHIDRVNLNSFGDTLRYQKVHTIKLLTRIWRILALRLVLPAKTFCKRLIKTCPSGALMKAP